jgi:hypothetical protein
VRSPPNLEIVGLAGAFSVFLLCCLLGSLPANASEGGVVANVPDAEHQVCFDSIPELLKPRKAMVAESLSYNIYRKLLPTYGSAKDRYFIGKRILVFFGAGAVRDRRIFQQLFPVLDNSMPRVIPDDIASGLQSKCYRKYFQRIEPQRVATIVEPALKGYLHAVTQREQDEAGMGNELPVDPFNFLRQIHVLSSRTTPESMQSDSRYAICDPNQGLGQGVRWKEG